MLARLIAGALATALIAPASSVDAASTPGHQRLISSKVRPLMERPVNRARIGASDRERKPTFSPGETWMEDGAIFGHPDDHG